MKLFQLKNQQNFKVPPMSRFNIRAKALSLRQQLGIADAERIDILRFLEMVLDTQFNILEVNICEETLLGSVEAVTVVRQNSTPMILIPSAVYEAARVFEPRALFTICHELGHVFLHANYGPWFDFAPDNWPAFKSSEWQANEFAAEFLVPAHLIRPIDTVESLVVRFGVSDDVASRRLRNYRK